MIHGKNVTFIYQLYNPITDNFEKNSLKLAENIKDVSIEIHKDLLHIVYIARCKKHYTVNYTNLKDTNTKTLGFGIDSFCFPYMFSSNEKLNIMWEERYYIYSTKTNDTVNFSKINITNKTDAPVIYKYTDNRIEYKTKSTYQK